MEALLNNNELKLLLIIVGSLISVGVIFIVIRQIVTATVPIIRWKQRNDRFRRWKKLADEGEYSALQSEGHEMFTKIAHEVNAGRQASLKEAKDFLEEMNKLGESLKRVKEVAEKKGVEEQLKQQQEAVENSKSAVRKHLENASGTLFLRLNMKGQVPHPEGHRLFPYINPNAAPRGQVLLPKEKNPSPSMMFRFRVDQIPSGKVVLTLEPGQGVTLLANDPLEFEVYQGTVASGKIYLMAFLVSPESNTMKDPPNDGNHIRYSIQAECLPLVRIESTPEPHLIADLIFALNPTLL